jgi:hypothetical protein
MEKNPTHCSTSHLQKQWQHSTTWMKSSCSTMDLIEDVWFNALSDLEDIDTPANMQTQLHSRTMLQPNGLTVTDKYGTTSTQMDPVPQITSWIGTTNWRRKSPMCTQTSTHWSAHSKTSRQQIQRNAGGTIKPKAKRYRDIDSRLFQLKECITSGRIDVIQYSDAASHLLHLD